jgi:hypothetical protein
MVAFLEVHGKLSAGWWGAKGFELRNSSKVGVVIEAPMITVRISGVASCALVAASANAGVVFVTDNVFDPAQWQFTQFAQFSEAGVAGSATQVVAGAPGGAGNARSVSTQLLSAGLGWSVSLFGSASIDPGAAGEVVSIELSMDFRVTQGSNSLVGLALSQGGTVFRSNGVTVSASGSNWSSVTLLATSFTRLSSSGPTAPDLSTSGSPFTLGYYVANSNSAAATYAIEGANFQVEITTVPSPSIVSLVPALAMARLGRRRR